MTLQESIDVLKELKRCGYGIMSDKDKEAIDTVVSAVENPTYTPADMDSFAEWTAIMQWIYDPTDKCWFQKHSSETKTTAQLRELWEQERREK